MLVSLLSSQYNRFNALAEAWLAMGASSFSILQDNRVLAQWPASRKVGESSLVIPVMCEDRHIGDLRLTGISGDVASRRLEADAALIGYLLQLENDLQSLTADLVTSQDQQLALYRLMQSMRSYVTIEETLQALVFEAIRMTRVQFGFALYVSPNNEPLIVQLPEPMIDNDLIWRCYWESQVVNKDVLTDEDLATEQIFPTSNLVFAPIHVHGAIVAGLGMVNRQGYEFTMAEVKLVRALADQASAQLEKVLLYQESIAQAQLRTEMELARRVQLDLLPRELPRVEGLDIFAFSRPAYQVGGDFYDFICQHNRPFIFSIGDVIGKGLSAALLMTMTRSAIHSKAYFMPEPTPEAMMRQSNEDLYNDFTQVGVFATVFIGQFEPDSQRLMYANAGHSPVIYRPRDGKATLLKADSTALGILETSFCRNHYLPMRVGDLLIAATDGFSDSRNPSEEMFGIDALLCLTDKIAHLSAREIADSWFDTLDRFRAGRAQDDDQTLVVVKGARV